mgnify:CR=1 FL=1
MKISPVAPSINAEKLPPSAPDSPADAPSMAPSDAERRIAASMQSSDIISDINSLAQSPRVHRTDQQRAAAFAVAKMVKEAGWDVHIEELQTPIGPVVNVVADKAGTAPAAERKLVIAGAHLDSVPRAPGGDDNASGSATMIEMARALKDQPLPNDVRIVWFDGEERGLYGSQAHARNMQRSDIDRTIAMVNADMIGAPFGTVGFSVGATTTAGLGQHVSEIAARNGVSAEFRPERHSRSDHHSFDRVGIPSLDFGVSVRTVDREDPSYHSPRDTASNISAAVLEAHADLVALTVLDLAQRGERVPGAPPPRGIRIDDGPPI